MIDYQIITQNDRSQIITEKKIFDTKKRVSTMISEKHSSEVFHLKVIGVDSKNDKNTLAHILGYDHYAEPIIKRTVKDEHHLTFTAESGPFSKKYLTHIEIKNGTGITMATETLKILKKYNSISSLEAIVLDNTSANTGVDNGLVVTLERLLNRRIHLIGCVLHQNELPLRHVIAEVDGKSNDPKKYKGPIGQKASASDLHNLPIVDFVPIHSEIDSYVNSNILSDLSTDQRKLYEYCIGISKGFISPKYSIKKPGPVYHARWLTLALRIMMVYARVKNPTDELCTITKYIVQVYCPMWFAHKRSGLYKDAPRLLHKTIELVKNQADNIQQIVFQNLQGNSYCCLQENFLYSMLQDDEKDIRAQAIKQVLHIRQSREVNPEVKPKIKAKLIMPINFNAYTWSSLVDVSLIEVEPPTSILISSFELENALQTSKKPILTDLPNNSQSVERSVKLVSEASKIVYGQVKRHNFILTKNQSRAENICSSSKTDYFIPFP